MAQEPIENLSVNELTKRKKFAALILGVMLGLGVVNVVVALVTGRLGLLAVVAALFVTGLPMLIGVKKISVELAKRGTT